MSDFSSKMLAMWRNSTSAFFGLCVLWTKDLGQRHLKARRRKKAGYAEPAFGIWENCLKTAVCALFWPKSVENKLGIEWEERQRRTALCLCCSASMPREAAGLGSEFLFLRKCKQFDRLVWLFMEVRYFYKGKSAEHFWQALQLCSRSWVAKFPIVSRAKMTNKSWLIVALMLKCAAEINF